MSRAPRSGRCMEPMGDPAACPVLAATSIRAPDRHSFSQIFLHRRPTTLERNFR